MADYVHSASSHSSYLECPLKFKLDRERRTRRVSMNKPTYGGMLSEISSRIIHPIIASQTPLPPREDMIEFLQSSCTKLYEEILESRVKDNIKVFHDVSLEKCIALAVGAIDFIKYQRTEPLCGEFEKEWYIQVPCGDMPQLNEMTVMPITGHIDYLPYSKDVMGTIYGDLVRNGSDTDLPIYDKVVDWKISTTVPDPEKYFHQMGLYAWAMYEKLKKPVVTELNWVYYNSKKNMVEYVLFPRIWSHEELTHVMREIKSTWLMIMQGIHPANPWAKYHDSCIYKWGDRDTDSICPYNESRWKGSICAGTTEGIDFSDPMF